MRDTDYATELRRASLPYGEHELRVERLFVKEEGQEEIRFSWWKNGNIVPRPLDLPEDGLIDLFRLAVEAGVFTDDFRARLRAIL
jgi:hypothetical protein